MGPSGSGKSTLMHCMAGVERPTSGRSFVGGLDIGHLDDAGLTRLRRDRIGFVFQSFNLVPTLTAAENITLPAALAGAKVNREWLDYLAGQLGIADRLTHRPGNLDSNSSAYADRVIFLADGAVVGALDWPTADSVLERMRTLGA